MVPDYGSCFRKYNCFLVIELKLWLHVGGGTKKDDMAVINSTILISYLKQLCSLN